MTQNGQRRRRPNTRLREQAMQIIQALHGGIVKSDNQVALAHAGGGSWRVRLERGDEHAAPTASNDGSG